MPPIESFSAEARNVHTELRGLHTTLAAGAGDVVLNVAQLQAAMRTTQGANERPNRRANESVLTLLRDLTGKAALTYQQAVDLDPKVRVAAADRAAKATTINDFLAAIPAEAAAKADAETLHKQVRDALTSLQRTVATDVAGRTKSFADFIAALRGLEDRHAPSDIYRPLRDRLVALYPGADTAASLAAFVETQGRDQAALRTLAGELKPGDYPAGMSQMDRTALQMSNAIDGYVANAMTNLPPQALQIAQLFFGGNTPQETGRNIAAFFRWMAADTLAGLVPDASMRGARPLYERGYGIAEALHWQTAKEEYGRANPGAITTPPITPLPAVRDPVTGAMVVPPSPEPTPVITIPNEAVIRGRWTECYRLMWRARRNNAPNVPDMPNLVQLSTPDGETVKQRYVEQVQKLVAPSGAPSTVPTTPEQRVKRMNDFFAAGDPHNVLQPYAADRHLISNNNTHVSFYKTGAVLYVRLGDREVRVQTPAPNTDANAISLTKPVAPDTNPDNVVIKINGTATGVKLSDLVTHLQLGTNISNTHVMITPNSALATAITSRVEAGADTPETRMNAFFASGVNQNITNAYNAGEYLLMPGSMRVYFYRKPDNSFWVRLGTREVEILKKGGGVVADPTGVQLTKTDNTPGNVVVKVNGAANGVKLSEIITNLTTAANLTNNIVVLKENSALATDISSHREYTATQRTERMNTYFGPDADKNINAPYNATNYVISEGDERISFYKNRDGKFYVRIDDRVVLLETFAASPLTSLMLTKPGAPGTDPELIKIRLNGSADGITLGMLRTHLNRGANSDHNRVRILAGGTVAGDIASREEYEAGERVASLNTFFGGAAFKDITENVSEDRKIITSGNKRVYPCKAPGTNKLYIYINDRLVQIESQVPLNSDATALKVIRAGDNPDNVVFSVNGAGDTGVTLGSIITRLETHPDHNRIAIKPNAADAVTSRDLPL